MCEICLKLTIKTPWRWQWSHSGVFSVNFEQILHFALLILLLTLNKMLAGWEASYENDLTSQYLAWVSLREKYPNKEFFLLRISALFTKCLLMSVL